MEDLNLNSSLQTNDSPLNGTQANTSYVFIARLLKIHEATPAK